MSFSLRCSHPPSRQTYLFPARDYISGEHFALEQCGECGLVRTTPQPTPASTSQYYPPGYYGRANRYGGLLEWSLRLLYASRARLIERVSGGRPGRVLDVGCGRGQLLYQLQKRGWEVAGTELSDLSARFAREVLNLQVQVGDLASLAIPDQIFNTVILWHVLEHVADPAGLVKEVGRILGPRGTFIVAVPNFASPEARFGGARWFHLDVPRHLYHFTPESLRRLLDDVGLHPIETRFFAPEYDFFSFVQTVLNALGVRHNLLYNMIRTRGAKVLRSQERSPWLGVLVSLILAPLLGAASLLWVPVAALSSRGATVIMIARRD